MRLCSLVTSWENVEEVRLGPHIDEVRAARSNAEEVRLGAHIDEVRAARSNVEEVCPGDAPFVFFSLLVVSLAFSGACRICQTLSQHSPELSESFQLCLNSAQYDLRICQTPVWISPPIVEIGES